MATSRPSALDTTFWVTTSDIAVDQPAGKPALVGSAPVHQRRGQQGGEVVAGPHLADPGDREDGQCAGAAPGRAPGRPLSRRHRGPSGTAAADVPRSDMTVGATTHRTPSASTAAASPASASSTTRVPTHGAYQWATPTTEDSKPISHQQAVGRALQRGSGDDGGDGHDPVAPALRAPRARRARPAAGRWRRPGSTGRRRRSSAPRDGLEHAGPGTGVVGPLEADPATATSWRSRTKYSWKPTSGPSTSCSRVRSGSSVTGTTSDADAEAIGELGGDRAQGGALRQPLGAVAVGGQVPVAEVEPGDPAEPLERLHDAPGLAGQAPPGLGVDGVGQRVDHRVEVRGDVQPVEHGVVAGVDDGGDPAGVARPRPSPAAAGRRRLLRPGR